jgi:hypothetical protein
MKSKLNLMLAVVGLVAAGSTTGCLEDEVMGPPPDCQENHKATMQFKNESGAATYDVVLDGAEIGTIGPGKSLTRDMAAGHHTFAFYFAGTSNMACNTSTPNLAQCDSHVFSCDSEP